MRLDVITKHETVVQLNEKLTDGEMIHFDNMTDYEEGGSLCAMIIDADTWEHMGSPETLTVAVQAGDHLNVVDPFRDTPKLQIPDDLGGEKIAD